MNFKLKAAAAAIAAASLIASFAYASDLTPPAKKHVATRRPKRLRHPRLRSKFRLCARNWKARSIA